MKDLAKSVTRRAKQAIIQVEVRVSRPHKKTGELQPGFRGQEEGIEKKMGPLLSDDDITEEYLMRLTQDQ